MVACFGPHEGPWLRSRGNETGIKITCLGEGEYVVMRHQNGTSEVHELTFRENGVFPLTGVQFRRVSFVKHGGVKPTTVELVID